MSKIVGIGAYAQPVEGKLLGTSGCAPCAAAAMGAEAVTPEQQAAFNAQLEQGARNVLIYSAVGFVGILGFMWWLGARGER